jgi:NADPH:quinone reductase-like Zn-dependent oxidoreductase
MKRRRLVLRSLLLVIGAGALLLAGLWFSSDTVRDPLPGLLEGEIPMRAIVHDRYGAPEVLELAEIARPVPADDELLVKVHAAAVNPLDWHYLRGEPYFMRLESGLRAPKSGRLGVDFAGTVEAVGRNVTRFKPGDEVLGGKWGAFAEYVSVREDRAVVSKPAGLTFEQAAAVPVAAITALQALRDKGQLRAGQQVLINGASGGVGTFAVQIAKSLGAEVTGVCSTRNVQMVRSIGADHVVDYTKEDFVGGERRYDLIVDNVGNRSLRDLRRVLKPGGTVVIVGGPSDGKWIGPLVVPIKAFLYSPFVSERFVFLLSELNAKDLAVLRDMLEAGSLRPVIDRRYPLEETRAAIEYLETGRARGKVVIATAKTGIFGP